MVGLAKRKSIPRIVGTRFAARHYVGRVEFEETRWRLDSAAAHRTASAIDSVDLLSKSNRPRDPYARGLSSPWVRLEELKRTLLAGLLLSFSVPKFRVGKWRDVAQ